jgi:inner membrane protein
MDNLTHTLTGVALARLGIARRVEGATLTLALANNLPDIDLVSGLWGTVSYLQHHRAISHAFPASPFLAAGLAVVLSRWPGSKRRFLPTFLLAWLGVTLHIFWDLWTSYGTRILLPFDPTWYSLDWVFIVDPVFLLLLMGACWLTTEARKRSAALLACGYIGLRAAAHSMALGQAESLAGSEFTKVRAMPDPLSLNKWRFIASSDETFATGYVPAFGTARSKVAFPRVRPDALALRVAGESHAASVFLDFSAFSRFETRNDGGLTVFVWRDLRFADRRADGFLCEVRVDAAGRIVSDRVIF